MARTSPTAPTRASDKPLTENIQYLLPIVPRQRQNLHVTVAFQAVGIRITTQHDCAQQWMPVAHRGEDDLAKSLGQELHLANFIGNRHVTPFHGLPQRRHTHALHLIDIHAILRNMHRTRMAGGREKSHVAIERYNPKSLSDSAALQVLSIETGSPQVHARHDLPDQGRFAATGLPGHQVRRFQTLTLCRNRYPIADTDNGTSIGESQVKQHVFRSQSTRPWSPLSVSLITFFLPAGGAVLTIQNLARLQTVNPLQARRQTIEIVILYALGFAIILSLAPIQAGGTPRLDAGTYSVIQFGFAAAAYAVQRGPFRAWKVKQTSGTSAWTSGVLTALIYQLLAIFITVPVYAGVAAVVSSTVIP